MLTVYNMLKKFFNAKILNSYSDNSVYAWTSDLKDCIQP
jgi:hypothetical protein